MTTDENGWDKLDSKNLKHFGYEQYSWVRLYFYSVENAENVFHGTSLCPIAPRIGDPISFFSKAKGLHLYGKVELLNWQFSYDGSLDSIQIFLCDVGISSKTKFPFPINERYTYWGAPKDGFHCICTSYGIIMNNTICEFCKKPIWIKSKND